MNCVIRVSDKTKEKMIKYYEDKKRDKVIPYVIFQAQDGDTVITMYESGKIMFQGTTADVDSSMWLEMDGQSKKDSPEVKEKEKKYYYCSSIGSDEVGTGDYFGPIVVTASFVKKEDIPYLEKLGIKDSKKLTDEKILDIAPKVAKKISYKSLILSNQEYNEKHDRILTQVLQEMENLPPRSRVIMEEVFIHNMKYREVAEKYNVSISTVKTLLGNAVRKLRERLDKEKFAGFLFFFCKKKSFCQIF